MIKLLIFVSLILLNSVGEANIVEGTVMVYYSKKKPVICVDLTDMYCLDSIRFYKDSMIYPVKGDYLQHEHFVYESDCEIGNSFNVFRNHNQFCTNPLENYIHSGGDIYEIENDSNMLIIGFNVAGLAYHIIPEYNSKKNDSLFADLKKSYDALFINDSCEPCLYFVNDNEYYIFSNEIKTATLSGLQLKKFRLFKSEKDEFLRYGQW